MNAGMRHRTTPAGIKDLPLALVGCEICKPNGVVTSPGRRRKPVPRITSTVPKLGSNLMLTNLFVFLPIDRNCFWAGSPPRTDPSTNSINTLTGPMIDYNDGWKKEGP
ncbi:uncharacterized protein MCYG_02107 [Microsporum canis CBS 113480]|uniref:Uncharacterized protein n=1 Tax=Arthroderma otae (strain ATCC MYA-4605 / CBS 113480) TaxID=554155 RepID=C5FIL9_ARTOC|nr:uncharacterized protein MCYG_02107 [Microsporum canis CBS 113480]EEQ29288.1 predicted protein [Microsporum canis CBS 113480]